MRAASTRASGLSSSAAGVALVSLPGDRRNERMGSARCFCWNRAGPGGNRPFASDRTRGCFRAFAAQSRPAELDGPGIGYVRTWADRNLRRRQMDPWLILPRRLSLGRLALSLRLCLSSEACNQGRSLRLSLSRAGSLYVWTRHPKARSARGVGGVGRSLQSGLTGQIGLVTFPS